jgi:HPr kinase/phosphorylase
MSNTTIHATALLVGEQALLIRGAAGTGKSSLALSLIREAQYSNTYCVRLIADDRVYIERLPHALLARAPSSLAGRIEERGKGIIDLPYETYGIIRAVLELDETARRLPADDEYETEISGLKIPRFFHAVRAPLALASAISIMEKPISAKACGVITATFSSCLQILPKSA